MCRVRGSLQSMGYCVLSRRSNSAEVETIALSVVHTFLIIDRRIQLDTACSDSV